jgi:hypothetical protein
MAGLPAAAIAVVVMAVIAVMDRDEDRETAAQTEHGEGGEKGDKQFLHGSFLQRGRYLNNVSSAPAADCRL